METPTTRVGTVDRATLLDAVKLAAKHTGRAIPAVEHIHTQIADGAIVLSATDLDVHVTVRLDADTTEAPPALLDASALKRACMVGGGSLSLSVTAGGVDVTDGRLTANLPSGPIADWLDAPDHAPDMHALSAEQMARVATVATFAEKDPRKPVLGGVHFGGGHAVSTDAYRMAGTHGLYAGLSGLLPASVITLAGKLDNVSIGTVDRHYMIQGTHVAGPQSARRRVHVTYRGGQIDGSFPAWRKLVPDTYETRVVVTDPAEAADTILKGSKMIDGKGVPLTASVDETVTVCAAPREGAGFTATLPAEIVSGPGLKWSANPAYLADVLAAMGEGECTWDMRDGLTPSVFTSHDARTFALLMPMKID